MRLPGIIIWHSLSDRKFWDLTQKMAEKICPGDSLVGNIWIKLANNGVKLFCPTIMLLADSYRHVNETHCEKG